MFLLLLAVIQYLGMYVDTILPFFITYVSTFYIKFISTWTFFHPKHGQKGGFCQLPASPCPRSNGTTPNVYYASDYSRVPNITVGLSVGTNFSWKYIKK